MKNSTKLTWDLYFKKIISKISKSYLSKLLYPKESQEKMCTLETLHWNKAVGDTSHLAFPATAALLRLPPVL